MDKESIIRYKFYLCRKFLNKLLDEKIITKSQKSRLENAVIKRIAEI